MKSYPVCPVCESREYELRDGNYFCVLCSTQSQELGLEKVMEEDQLLSLGMRLGTSISVAGYCSIFKRTYIPVPCLIGDLRCKSLYTITKLIRSTH